MTAIELSERLEVLEVRYAHQEAALEELTRTLLAQEQLIRSQRERLERLEQDVRALQGGVHTAVADEKPPHY
jgi:SlyX protein